MMTRKHPVIVFFMMTFAITWGLSGAGWALLATGVLELEPSGAEITDGEGFGVGQGQARQAVDGEPDGIDLAPGAYILIYVAVWAPTISALLTTWLATGRTGALTLLRQVLRWRAPPRWWAAALLIPPALYLAAAVAAAVYAQITLLEHLPNSVLLWGAFLLLNLSSGPAGEELGWRGFALPRMIEHMHAKTAAVLLGCVWALWHLPVFFVPGLERVVLPPGFGYLPFCILLVAASVLICWVYLSGRRVLLLAIGFHFMVNTALMAVSKDPEVEVVWASVAAFVLAALLVLLFGRFTPRRGVDEAE